jgi:hypothetical protein
MFTSRVLKSVQPAGAALLMLVSALTAPAASAQTQVVAKPAGPVTEAELSSLCNPQKIRTSGRGGRLSYTCEGKPPTPRPGTQVSAAPNRPRAEINCNYSEKDGVKTWLGCTCKENDDGNCTNFITWCAEQGDEVGGNSGAASCMPGGG